VHNGENEYGNGYHHDKKENYDPVDALYEAPDIIDDIENWLPDLTSNKSEKETDDNDNNS